MTSTYATPATPIYPRYRWVVLTSWMLPHLWSFVFLSSLGLMLPYIREELGLTGFQEGLLGGGSQLANILLAIPFGWFLSRFNPRLITSISLICAAGMIFFQAWAPIFLLLLLGRFLFGVTAVARESAWVMLVRRWVPPREIVIANTLGNFMWGFVALGIMVVPLLITWLDDSWRNASNVIGLSLLALSMGWLVLGRDGKHLDTSRYEPVQRINPLAIVRRYKELWILAAGMFGNGVNFTGFSVFWPSFRIAEFDNSLFEVSVVMGIGGVFTSISGLTVGLIVSRRGWKRKVLIFSGIVLATTTIGTLWVGPIWALVLLFVVQSAGWTFFPSATTIPYELPGIKPRETVVAISALFMSLWGGSFVGPILSGLVQDSTGDLRLALVITSLGPLLMTIGALFLSKKWDLPPSYERTPPDTAKRAH